MKTITIIALAIAASVTTLSCDEPNTTDRAQTLLQQQSLAQAHEKVGMPAITNWQEKRFMKDLYELRDKAIATHSYIVNEMNGCLVYLGPSVGYGMPYSTQYSSPESDIFNVGGSSGVHHNVPQAEPNGLFMPSSADGTWIMLVDPTDNAKTMPVYIEPRVVVSPFRLVAQECKSVVQAVVPVVNKK
jgi:hypothetical protein